VFGVGDCPEPIAMFDEAVFFEALQGDAPLEDIDSIDNLIQSRLVRV